MLNLKFIKGGASLDKSHKTYQPINLANIQNYINNAIDKYILTRFTHQGELKHSYSNIGKIAYVITLGNYTYIMCKHTNKYTNTYTNTSSDAVGYKIYHSKCLYVLKKSGGKNKNLKSKNLKSKKQKSKNQKTKKQKSKNLKSKNLKSKNLKSKKHKI